MPPLEKQNTLIALTDLEARIKLEINLLFDKQVVQGRLVAIANTNLEAAFMYFEKAVKES